MKGYKKNVWLIAIIFLYFDSVAQYNEVIEIDRAGTADLDMAHEVLKTSAGLYVVGANYIEVGGIFLVKYNSDFTIAWKKQYGSDTRSEYNLIAKTVIENGIEKIIIAGSINAAVGNTMETFAMKINLAGIVEWENVYERPDEDNAEPPIFIHQVNKQSNHNILLGTTNAIFKGGNIADVYLIQISIADGSVMWQNIYDYNSADDYGASAINDTNGDVFITGITGDNNNKDGLLFKIDPNNSGALLGSWIYQNSNPNDREVFYSIIAFNGGYLLCGRNYVSNTNSLFVPITVSGNNISTGQPFELDAPGSVYNAAKSAISTNDNGALVIGDVTVGSIRRYLAHKISSNGTLEWSLVGLSNSSDEGLLGACQYDSDSYFLSGYSNDNIKSGTLFAVADCQSTGMIENCMLQPDTYTLINKTGTFTPITMTTIIDNFPVLYNDVLLDMPENIDIVSACGNSITITGPSNICNGTNALLQIVSNTEISNYLWSNGSTSSSINVSPLVNTTYTVSVTLVSGCQLELSHTITISNMPNISILCTDPDICLGESVTLSANPACIGCTYSWSPGGATSNSITVSPAVTTNYSVLVTNAQGCFDFASQQVTVDQNCPPTSLCMHIDQTGNTDVGRRVTATSDGGFVAIGDISGAHNAADRDLYVIKYKPDMTVDFRKRIGDYVSGTTTYIYNESGFDVMPLVDGYLVAGTVTISTTNTNIILLKLDLNGNFVWRTTRTSATTDKIDETRKIVRISPLSGAPSRYYLVGHTNGGTPTTDFDIIIYEFNPANGNIIGTPQRFGDTGVSEFATDAIANDDQNAIIVSGFADVSSTNRDMFALKVSANLVWASSFYNGGAGTDVLNSVAQVGKDLFFAGSTRTWGHSTTSNIYVLKVDESMFTATTNRVYSSNIDEVANTIIKTSDNNLLLVGSYRTMDAVNMKIDDDLNQLWLFKSSLSRIETFNGVTEQSDGLFAAVGMYNEGVSDDEFYISRIKPNGSSCCNTSWSLQEITGMNPNLKGGQRNGTLSPVKWGLIDNAGIEKYLCQDFTMVRVASNNEESSFDAVVRLRGFKVIPNPSNGIFKLMFENELENVTTNIYDLSGRLVKSIYNLSASTINIDLSKLNDGIYLLEATGDGFSERQKIVIRK